MNILLHKIMIVILKFIPIILSLIYLIGTISSILGKSTIVLSYLGFVSFLPGLFILLSSFVFKFCAPKKHRGGVVFCIAKWYNNIVPKMGQFFS